MVTLKVLWGQASLAQLRRESDLLMDPKCNEAVFYTFQTTTDLFIPIVDADVIIQFRSSRRRLVEYGVL
jgi:hypothetical protein